MVQPNLPIISITLFINWVKEWGPLPYTCGLLPNTCGSLLKPTGPIQQTTQPNLPIISITLIINHAHVSVTHYQTYAAQYLVLSYILHNLYICWWPQMLGNGQHMLGNGQHMLGNGPYLCNHLMIRVMLIKGRLSWVLCLSWPNWVR